MQEEQVAAGFEEVGVVFQAAPHAGMGLFDLADFHQGQAERAMRAGIGGVELDGALQALLRGVEAAQLQQHGTHGVVRGGEQRIDLQGAFVAIQHVAGRSLVAQGAAEVEPGFGEVGTQRQGGAAMGDGLVHLPQLAQEVAEVAVRVGQLRRKFHGLAKAGGSFVGVAAFLLHAAEIIVRFGMVGLQGDGLTQAGFGFGQAIEGEQEPPEVGVGAGMIGLDGDGTAVACLGKVDFPEEIQGVAQIVVRLGEAGHERDGAAAAFYCRFSLPELAQDVAQIAVDVGVAGQQFRRALRGSEGFRQRAGLLQDGAEHFPARAPVGPVCQQGPRVFFSFGMASGLEQGDERLFVRCLRLGCGKARGERIPCGIAGAMRTALPQHAQGGRDVAPCNQCIEIADPESRARRLGGHGCLEVRQRLGGLAGLEGEYGEIVVGIGLGRRPLEDGLIKRRGLGEPSGAVMGHGALQRVVQGKGFGCGVGHHDCRNVFCQTRAPCRLGWRLAPVYRIASA